MDDVPEERMQEILNDPGFQAWAENMTREAKERQLRLRQDEQTLQELEARVHAVAEKLSQRFRGIPGTDEIYS